MDLGNYSSQSHVAQQSRRNKLRVQQNTQQIEDYPSTLDQLNPNHAQISNIGYGNISYDPSLISSEMHNFTTNNSQFVSTRMPKDCGDQQNLAPWRSCEWVENYLGGGQNVYSIGEGSMSVTKAYDPPSSLYREPSFDLYQGVHGASFTKLSSQNSQKHYEDLHYNSLHHNTLPLAEICTEGLELAPIIDQTNIHHWSRDLNSTTSSDLITQGLSLSLSPVYPNKAHLSQLPDGLAYPEGNSKSNYLNSTLKKSVMTSSSKIFGKTGPLGPFTGYATILNSSKYLGPAQQLLGDICIVNASIMAGTSDALKNKIFNEANGFGNFANIDQTSTRVSSPRIYSSNENSEEVVRTRVVESFRPEYQQRKESLLFIQEEVNRRQKQYHQQMEMVVSSFESVSGLSATTPYISIAVNAISRNFCSLKTVISEQLRNVCKALGDASTSTKGDMSSSRLKFIDREKLMKQKIGGGNLGFSEPHSWRPQRGLPERAVAVLRAWLFEHFLHPYPTDTDKHMLASQTGLSRDQVSNWFINARVRLWKPMVEEIHALETNNIEMPNSINPEGTKRYASSSSNKLAGPNNYGDQLDHNLEKRPRTDYQNQGIDTPFMGFMPYQRSGLGIDIGGLGPVSLTLGLRQSPEEMGPQEQQHEQHHYFGPGQMVHHDFVG